MDRDTKSRKMGPNWNENSIIKNCRIRSGVQIEELLDFPKESERYPSPCGRALFRISNGNGMLFFLGFFAVLNFASVRFATSDILLTTRDADLGADHF